MSIPGYQSIMLPLLQFASDGIEHASSEPVKLLASQFALTDDEQRKLLPTGTPVFVLRVGWALTYLRQAGLVESTRRGFFKITQRGLDVLAAKPQRLDSKFLAQYPEFREFMQRSRKAELPQPVNDAHVTGEKVDEEIIENETPSELIEAAYQRLRVELAQTLLDRIKLSSPAFFERLIVELLIKMGYGGSRKDAGEAIGRSGDEGIDGIIREDRLGLDVIYLQAKRWTSGTVGRPEIQQFAGALSGQHARKGIYITTSSFTREARTFVASLDSKIILIDGEQLAEYMIDYDVGVATTSTYQIKHIDSDYFAEE